MNNFLKYEEQDAYWYFKPIPAVEFSTFETINYASWHRQEEAIKTQLQAKDGATAPSKKQVDTLNFVLEHQEEICTSIFNFHQQFLYPIYNQSIDIEEAALVHKRSQLSNVYSIQAIEIPAVNADGCFYYLLQFAFRYEDQSFYLLMEDASIIDFFGEGDKNYDNIQLYQEGLITTPDTPLEIVLYSVPFKQLLKGSYQFEEEIVFPLNQGAYRIMIRSTQQQYSINFGRVTNVRIYGGCSDK